MRRALIYCASAAAIALPMSADAQAHPIYVPVYQKTVSHGLKVCTQFNVQAFTARAMTNNPADGYRNGHCVTSGYPMASLRPPIIMNTPGGYVSGQLFSKAPRDEMEAQFDMQGKGEGSRNPLGGDDDDLEKVIGIVQKIKGIKDLVQSDEESVGSGKQNGGGDDDDDMQASGKQNGGGGGDDDDDMQASGKQNGGGNISMGL